MTDRYEAVAARAYKDRDGNEKTAFTNIGVAWKMKDRDGFNLKLHAIPAPDQGEYSILLFPPKPREEQQQQRSNNRGSSDRGQRQERDSYGNQPANFSSDLDDDIPFMCEWR